jgi:hypothetical protein
MAAHRVYVIFVGPVPKGVELHHRCLHGWCVNPWHIQPLLPDVHDEEHPAQRRIPTHCPSGRHVLDKKNLGLYERPNGKLRIECKACGRERMRARSNQPTTKAET